MRRCVWSLEVKNIRWGTTNGIATTLLAPFPISSFQPAISAAPRAELDQRQTAANCNAGFC